MKISCVPCYDMRSFTTVEAVHKIEEISCVAMVILPKTDDPALNAAFAAIPMDAVACVLRLDPNAEVTTINGNAVLSDANTVDNQFFILNGEMKILPLSENKHIKVVANGNIITDINNCDCVEFLEVNGNIEERDFANMIELSPNSILDMTRFNEEKAYYYDVPNAAIVEEVLPTATGTVESGIVIAHESVAKSKIKIYASHVVYVPKIEKYTFIRKKPKVQITKEFLENIEGKLVIDKVAHLDFSRDVTPELLKEKVLVAFKCAKVTGKRKLKSILPLKCVKCASIKITL